MPDRTSLVTLQRQVSEGHRSAVDVVTSALETIEACEREIQAWVRVTDEQALRTASDQASSGGALRGIPFGVKDIIDVQGLPTECGTQLRRGVTATRDADIVTRLRAAGAIPLGKTVTTEFAYFAPGPTRNPHNPQHTPGGSSSGSAAAVAAGMVPFALGSQTAGSLTRPAAFCGVAGFVPPAGTLSTTGFARLSHTLDTPGILAGSVEDVWDVYLALADTRGQLRNVAAPRIAVWPGTELGPVAGAMQAAVDHAADQLVAGGAHVEPLEWAGRTPALVNAHSTIMARDSSREFAEEAKHPETLSAQFNELLTTGSAVTPHEYDDARQFAARQREAALSLLQRVDAVLGPAALGAAPAGLSSTGSPVLSRPWHLLGLPVLTVPGYRTSAGLPLGLQLIGHPERIARLFAVGQQLQDVAAHSAPC